MEIRRRGSPSKPPPKEEEAFIVPNGNIITAVTIEMMYLNIVLFGFIYCYCWVSLKRRARGAHTRRARGFVTIIYKTHLSHLPRFFHILNIFMSSWVYRFLISCK